jgi:hypothetical protein
MGGLRFGQRLFAILFQAINKALKYRLFFLFSGLETLAKRRPKGRLSPESGHCWP